MKRTDNKETLVTKTIAVKDYGNDPCFGKRAAESKVFLETNGFPKELLAKKCGKIGL